MFGQVSVVLERAIGELEIPVDAAALTRCCWLLDRLSAKVTAAIGAFDAAKAWRDSGATSMTGWLRRHTGRSGRDASRTARTARRLGDLPVTAAAFEDGTLSGGQVQAIVANVNEQTVALFAQNENLGLFCTRHHHILHTPGWHTKLLPDGTIEITDPQSQVHTTQPPSHLDTLLNHPPRRPTNNPAT